MIRMYCAFILLTSCLVAAPGCGCGDLNSTRSAQIRQIGAGPRVVEVDTSQLPANSVRKYSVHRSLCDCPTTEVEIMSNQPFKVVLVPTTQP